WAAPAHPAGSARKLRSRGGEFCRRSAHYRRAGRLPVAPQSRAPQSARASTLMFRGRFKAAAAGLVLGAVLWLPLTSVALCFALKTLATTSPWMVPIAAFFYWRDFGGLPIVAHWLPLCAVAAGMVAAIPAVC